MKFRTIENSGTIKSTATVIIPYVIYWISSTVTDVNNRETRMHNLAITPFFSLCFTCGCGDE